MTGSVHLVCDQGSPILWRCRFFLIFKGKIIFHTPYFAFSSILWWTLWSLPPFAYCELTLLWTLVYKHLSRLLSISLEVELLDHMVTLCLIFLKNFYAIFHSGCTVQHPRFECIRASVSLHLCELFFFFFFYQLSHKGSPKILEWVAFSRGSSQPRNWTGVSCIAGWFFTNWAMQWTWGCIIFSR